MHSTPFQVNFSPMTIARADPHDQNYFTFRLFEVSGCWGRRAAHRLLVPLLHLHFRSNSCIQSLTVATRSMPGVSRHPRPPKRASTKYIRLHCAGQGAPPNATTSGNFYPVRSFARNTFVAVLKTDIHGELRPLSHWSWHSAKGVQHECIFEVF